MDADGAEGHHRQGPAVVGRKDSAHIHDVADGPPVLFQDQIQLRHKGGVAAQHMEHIVLGAAGAVHGSKTPPG